MNKIIKNFIAKMVAGRSDDGIMITLKDPKRVEFETAKFQELLMRNGIDPMAITNENQIKNIINQINKPKVVSQENPKFKGIMNRMTGKNVIKADFGPGFKKEVEKMKGKVDDDLPPPGSRGGPDDIAAPVQSAEETIKNMIEAEATNPRFLDYTIQSMLKMEPIDAMKEANKVIKREGPYKNLSNKEAKKILDDTEDHIFERNFKTPDDPDFDPESMADGGRIGLKGGLGVLSLDDRGFLIEPSGKGPSPYMIEGFQRGPKLSEEQLKELLRKIKEKDFKIKDPIQLMADGGRIGYKKGSVDLARRGFMKAAAGVGAGIGALKMGALKLLGKEGTKQVTKNIIKTDNVPGKPEWFDALVTKVINQGEEVTKKYATQEREIVHKLDIDKFEDVTVYRNLDTGEIRVSYVSPTNVGEDSVDLVYKKPLPDEGDPRPSAEFYAVEPEPRVVNRDGDMEMDGENLVNSVDDLMSDTSKLKIIAKGDAKPTLKEFVESKKKKDAVKSLNESPIEQAEYIEAKYGPGPEPDFDDIENFASGGIARMLGE